MCTNLEVIYSIRIVYVLFIYLKIKRSVSMCQEPEGGGGGSLVLCKTATPKSTVPNPQSTEIMSLAF